MTVVDSATFIRDYSSKTPVAARPELGEGGGFRPVVDLLVEQIECVFTSPHTPTPQLLKPQAPGSWSTCWYSIQVAWSLCRGLTAQRPAAAAEKARPNPKPSAPKPSPGRPET